MPGIIPMKVITVGNTSQSRVAQACDRCRSKKIRCDGIRPCCSQCATVGFECRTSDKLSRRAFPRGYTESLEERVRALEAEVHNLKDLLDEKDDIIDILERLHSSSPVASHHRVISPRSSNDSSGLISPRTTMSNGPQQQQQAPTPSSTQSSHSSAPQTGCIGHSKRLDCANLKQESRSSDESQDDKSCKQPRKRFHSPFSMYPRLDDNLQKHPDVRQSSTKVRRSTATGPQNTMPLNLQPLTEDKQLSKPVGHPNLDYFPLAGSDTTTTTTATTMHAPSHVSPSEWELLICSMDTASAGQADLYSSLELGWMPDDDGGRPTAATSVYGSLSDDSFNSPEERDAGAGHPYGTWILGESDIGGPNGLSADLLE